MVVDTGPYHVVRHPMYSGAVLLFVGMPLWLQSSAGTLLAIVLIGLFVLRIFIEESVLWPELPGYVAYAERAGYRLIPFLWQFWRVSRSCHTQRTGVPQPIAPGSSVTPRNNLESRNLGGQVPANAGTSRPAGAI